MFKRLLLSLAFLALAAPSLLAQDQATRVYVAYYQVSYGDLEEYLGSYNRLSVPILQTLVEEGAMDDADQVVETDPAHVLPPGAHPPSEAGSERGQHPGQRPARRV